MPELSMITQRPADSSRPDAPAKSPAAAPPAHALLTPDDRWTRRLFWLESCLLLALAQVLWAGYQLGAGNQSIQIPFLYKLHDPKLFPADAMINHTLADYPTLFYIGLSRLLVLADVPALYLTLHLATTFGVFVAATALARSIFGARRLGSLAGLLTAVMLLAGHHQALAGESLYSVGFTHTWAVFPLGLLALAFFYRDRLVPAFLLTGLVFNLHALEATYLAAFLGLWALASLRTLGWRKTLGLMGLLLAAASPTLVMILRHRQHFDGPWLQLMHIRSAQHSFPTSWWEAGNPDIPRFALVLALAALAMSFPAPPERRRKTAIIALAVGLMFVVGYVFTDLRPTAIVIRAQLFRVSRFVTILAFIYIAHGAAGSVAVLRDSIRSQKNLAADSEAWRAWLEVASAALTLLCLSVPVLLVLLPLALLVATLVALINGRLAWWQALVAGTALLIVLLAWRTIHFPLGSLTSDWSSHQPHGWAVPALLMLLAAAFWLVPHLHRRAEGANIPDQPTTPRHGSISTLAPSSSGDGERASRSTSGAGEGSDLTASAANAQTPLPVWLKPDRPLPVGKAQRGEGSDGPNKPRPHLLAVAAGAAPGVLLLAAIVGLYLGRQNRSADGWTQVQLWARQNTPANALFLTPIEPGGFRVFSQRAVVGERRDGTQLYFSSGFTNPWWERMRALQPGLLYNPKGTRQVQPGTPLGDLDDDAILKLCAQYQADYLVLPSSSKRGGQFEELYDQQGWSVYRLEASWARVPGSGSGSGGADLVSAQQQFLDEKVQPGIERNRKSDVRVQIVDPAGRPVYDLPYQINQTNSSFGFGATLPFFQKTPVVEPPGAASGGEGNIDPVRRTTVTPAQLAHFTELFNYSVTGPSGWWSNLERQPGKPDFADLDRYVNWCNQNRVRVEFHFLSGFQPLWLTDKMPMEQGRQFLTHAHQVVDRYRGKVDYWQVVDQRIGMDSSRPVFADLRQTWPQGQLGISDCTRFASLRPETLREQDMYRGLSDVRTLAGQKTRIDFVSFHAHQPLGLWAGGPAMYEVFDRFAKEGVKIHISALSAPDRGPIEGDVQQGQWTPQLQAQYYREFLAICFSHPAVEVVNLEDFGPGAAISGGGLLDAGGKPTPAFAALKELITQRWRTRVGGRLAVDGSVAFRGFQGDYELSVTLAPGKAARAAFQVTPGASSSVRIILDRDSGTLTLAAKPQ